MKRTVLIIILMAAVSFAYAGEQEKKELKKLTFEQVYMFKGERLTKRMPPVVGWADDNHYYLFDKGTLFKVHVKSGKRTAAMDTAKYKDTLKTIGKRVNFFAAADRSKDLNKFLFLSKGDIHLFDKIKNSVLRVTETKGVEQNPKLSPDGNKIAYTMAGNLYVYDVKAQETTRLTDDGSKMILNGYASWVYFEEIFGRPSRYKAFWWSPDSQKVAFMRFDQTDVPVFTIVNSKGVYGELEQTHYPKPGYPNPTVKLGIADTGKNSVQWLDVNDPNDHYLAFPEWNAKGDALYFQWMNRAQNHFKILRYDLGSKALHTAYQEKQKTWVDFMDETDYGIFKLDSFHLLKNGDFIIRSSKNGWHHLYYVKADGAAHQITSGEWFVFTLSHVDEKRKQVYFMTGIEDSTSTNLYKVDFQGQNMKRLTRGRGMHLPSVSPGGGYFTDRVSSLVAPAKADLYKTNGKHIRSLGDGYSEKVKEYDLAKPELFRIKTEDGYHLPAFWLLPPGFDKTRKYPVVFKIYGGPAAPTVLDRQQQLGDYFLAQQGIIVMSVDHRGSGHFGKKGTDLMHRCFSKWEIHDYIQAVKYLRTLPFIDSQKIGITGGSYGGYITAMALTKGADYFQYGIAHSPGFDWSLYDTVYTERYMGTPKDNPEGYKDGSVFTHIDKYKGMLRVTHGTMDDNAHMQATLQFIGKMQDAGKRFEFMLYPGERHGVRGKKRIARTKEDLDFWLKHFFNKHAAEKVNK